MKKPRITFVVEKLPEPPDDPYEAWLDMCPCCLERMEENAEYDAWRDHYEKFHGVSPENF